MRFSWRTLSLSLIASLSLHSGSVQAKIQHGSLPAPLSRVELSGGCGDFDLSHDGSKLLLKWEHTLIDAATSEVIHRFEEPRAEVSLLPNGQDLVVAHEDGSVEVFAVDDLKTPLIRLHARLRGQPWKRFAFSMDSRFLAALVGSGDPGTFSAIVLDLESGEQNQVEFDTPFGAGTLAIAGGGRVLAISTTAGDIRLWDVTRNQPLRTLAGETWIDPLGLPIPYRPEILSMDFSPDGRYVAAAVLGGRVKRWEVASGDPLPGLAFPPGLSKLHLSVRGLVGIRTHFSDEERPSFLTVWEFSRADFPPGRELKPSASPIREDIALWFRFAGRFASEPAFSGDGKLLAIAVRESDSAKARTSILVYSIQDLREASWNSK